MNDIDKLMIRCQIGTNNINTANDLLADCYGTLGKQQGRIAELKAENEALQVYIRELIALWERKQAAE